jgi:hypothetical protein
MEELFNDVQVEEKIVRSKKAKKGQKAKKSSKKTKKSKKPKKGSRKKEETKGSYIRSIACSKSLKITLPNFNSVGLSYTISMEIDPKDNLDKKKEELSKLVDQYLESDIQEVVKYYRSKSEELVNTVKEYEIRLESLRLAEKRLELRERVEKENSSAPQEDIDLD